MQFTRPQFTTPQKPVEAKGGFVTKTTLRRKLRLQEAKEALALLPGEGETLHIIFPGKFDLLHLILTLIDKLGTCERMEIATLSLSARNVTEMLNLLDTGTVKQLDILISDFFRKHDKSITATLVDGFTERGQRVASARTHCKICTLAMASGEKYVLEGSANLRTCHNFEQIALTNGVELYDWFSEWISEMMERHDVKKGQE